MSKDTLIVEQLKRTNRRIDTMQKTLDLLYEDRNMLEDIVIRLSEVERALSLTRDRQMEVGKNIQKDLKRVEFAVEDKVDEVKEIVKDKNIIVVKPELLQKVKETLGKMKRKTKGR